MSKHNWLQKYLTCSYYKYAPESFKGYLITGFSHGNRNIPIYSEIDLSLDERFRCGYGAVCKGKPAGIAELKKIIRAKIKHSRNYYTLCFGTSDSNVRVFVRTLVFEEYDSDGALRVYKELFNIFEKREWKYEVTDPLCDCCGHAIVGKKCVDVYCKGLYRIKFRQKGIFKEVNEKCV